MTDINTKYWIIMMKDNSGATLIGDDDGVPPPLDKDIELGPDLEGKDQGTLKAGTFTVSEESHDMEYSLHYVQAMLEIPLQTMIDAAEESKKRYNIADDVEKVEEPSNNWVLILSDFSSFHLIQSETRPTDDDIMALNAEFDEPKYKKGNYILSATHYTLSESAEFIAEVVSRNVKESGIQGKVSVKVDDQTILIEVEQDDNNEDVA